MGNSLRRWVCMFFLFFAAALPAEELYETTLGEIHLIHEEAYGDIAGAAASDLSGILDAYRSILGTGRQFTWPVLLERESSSASGYVSLPVARTVWETTPLDDFFPAPEWLHLLSLHEGRHMVQYETVSSGITDLARVLGGMQLMTALSHAYVPSWIFEGDAVVSETIYSEEGRGRSAEFTRRFRALLLEHPFITWEELTNGSYIHNMPNHYVYGYYLMGYLLNEYGINAAGKLLRTMGNFPVPYLSPTIAISAVTGRFTTPEGLFEAVKTDLLSDWLMDGREESPREQVYTASAMGYSYLADFLVEDGRITLLEYDRSHGLMLKEVYDGQVEEIRPIPAADADISPSYVAWVEHRPDPFDATITTAVLAVYDRESGKVWDIAQGIFTGKPFIEGDEVTVVSFDPHSLSTIHTYDIASSTLVWESAFDEPVYLSDVIMDGETYVAILEGDEGREVVEIDHQSVVTELFSLGHHFVSGLEREGDAIYLSSDENGSQELYRLDPGSTSLTQLTDSPYGLWAPRVIDGDLYAIGQESFDHEAIYHVEPGYYMTEGFGSGYVSGSYDLELPHEEIARVDDASLVTEPYNSFRWALNPYAWGILLPDRFDELSLGLRTADPRLEWQTYTSVGYIPGDGEFSARAGLTHQGRYLDAGLLGNLFYDTAGDLDYEVDAILSSSQYLERYGNALSHRIGVYGAVTDLYESAYPVTLGFIDEFSFGRIAPYRSIPGLSPGFSVRTNLLLLPDLNGVAASPLRANMDVTAAMPSFFDDHSVEVILSGEWRNSSGLPTAVTPARGYQLADVSPLAGVDGLLATAGISYELPILYPDASILSTLFTKRIRGAIFADATAGTQDTLVSAGVEFLADMTFFNRSTMQFSSGLRLSWRFSDNQPAIELILLDIPLFLSP